MGFTGNTATQHPEESRRSRVAGHPEGAKTTADYLPAGFFPMINASTPSRTSA
jgi:hypothetical protein